MSILVSYLVVVGITNLVMFVYIIMAFKHRTKTGYFLGATLAASSALSISYTLSFLCKSQLATSIFSSLQFIGMDFVTLLLLAFAISYTEANLKNKHNKIVLYIMHSLMVIDMVLCILNPFLNEFSVTIVKSHELINGIYGIVYNMHPAFYYHLFITYAFVALTVQTLISKSSRVPSGYKLKYLNPVFGIALVVLVNAIYLFLPSGPWNYLDYSLLTYGVVSVFIYWCVFKYAKKDLLFKFKASIFDSIGQGILLFDFNNELLLVNSIAKKYFSKQVFSEKLKLDDFACANGMCKKLKREDDLYSFQLLIEYDRGNHPIRCDFRKLYNKNNELIGKLLVFADMSAEIDLLTGFQTWENFKRFAHENNDSFTFPASIGICDIIGLGVYNEVHGREKGDNLLRELSALIQQEFNSDCHFIRGREAALIVLTYGLSVEEMNDKFDKINEKFTQKVTYSCLVVNDETKPIVQSILLTFSGINAKRLLDKRSMHSSVIGSLVKALQECDTDTEAHVKRTQIVGTALGRRIGLSDLDLSNLSLLCLLHDIGKIGVPLEILNKPGKLTPAEWESIQSHVIKGYNIAMSSDELKDIALMIKHHHERWDGKGYPDGLSKESIPILSRIIAVVDAYDAMVNDRCYRKALPASVAKEEILKNAGTQFDPMIAAEFLRLIEEGSFYKTKEESVQENKTSRETYRSMGPAEHKEVAVYPVRYSKYMLDSNDVIISIDDEFTRITGYTMEDITSRHMNQADLIPEEERAAYASMAVEQIGRRQMAYFEHRLVCKDGKTKFVLCIGAQKFDSVERDMRVEIIICDALQTNTAKTLSEFIEAKNNKRLEQWESMYRKDSLTGLLTHKSFQNDIEELLLKGADITLCMIDIDYFKQYNDTYGHHAGDEFLIAFAQGILTSCGDDCLCCRMGGDEFAIAIVGEQDIVGFANRLTNNLDFLCSSNKYPVTISLGLCQSDKEINTFNSLYEHADQALYEAKKTGRNKYSIYKK